MPFTTLKYVLWVAPACGQVLLSWFMFKRRLYREYPLFFVYTLSHVVRFVVLFSVYHHGSKQAYRETYLAAEVLDAALAFAAIYEVFSNVFQRYEGIRKVAAIVFRWALVVLIFAAVWVAAGSTRAAMQRVLAGVFVFDQGVNIVRGGWLLLFLIFCSYLRLRWNHFVTGIALGFALESSVEVVGFVALVHLGPLGSKVLSLIFAAAYNCAVLIWLYYLLSPVPVERPSRLPSRSQLDEWNHMLLEFIYR